MTVLRIEQIKAGVVAREADPATDGKYRCFFRGSNMDPVLLSTLDEVADFLRMHPRYFLRMHPRSGVRMTPHGGVVRDNIFIDGAPR
jgi:hypothetical protein